MSMAENVSTLSSNNDRQETKKQSRLGYRLLMLETERIEQSGDSSILSSHGEKALVELNVNENAHHSILPI